MHFRFADFKWTLNLICSFEGTGHYLWHMSAIAETDRYHKFKSPIYWAMTASMSIVSSKSTSAVSIWNLLSAVCLSARFIFISSTYTINFIWRSRFWENWYTEYILVLLIRSAAGKRLPFPWAVTCFRRHEEKYAATQILQSTYRKTVILLSRQSSAPYLDKISDGFFASNSLERCLEFVLDLFPWFE